MATRQIKDAKDLSTNELIYFKGHAQATFMSDGRTVEEAVNSIGENSGSTDLSNYYTKTEIDNKGFVEESELATVATTGNYNDLSNKPTIPSAVTQSTVSGWGFTKNTGTITGVSANGTSVATSGVANIPAATTSKYGVTRLSSSTSSTSTTLAATASAVKAAYDLANSYKGTVTGVKVNGTTYSPSGGVVDLGTIESGGGSSGGSGAYAEVNHGTSDTTFTLTPNTFHVWDEVASLDLTLGNEISGIANEYLFQFTSGSTATTLSLPDDITWTGGETPTIESNKIYQVSILKGLGSVLEWDSKSMIIFTVSQYPTATPQTFSCESGMTWEEFINSEYNNNTFTIYTQYNNQIRWSSNIAYGVLEVSPSSVIVNNMQYTSKYGD